MKQLARITGLAAVAALFLVGCGDDSSSSPSGKAAEYATLEEAGDCAPSRYGETIFVTREGEFYFCGGKKWVILDDGEDDDEGRSSTMGTSESGGKQAPSSEKGSSEGGNSGTGTSQDASSDKQTTSSSQRGDYVPHKPDILQWGANYTTVTINDTVKFTLTYLTDANGVDDIKDYEWNFGDGTMLRKTDSSFVEHAYPDTGSYTISITVTDSNGDSVTKSLVIAVINPLPTADAGSAKQCYNTSSCTFSGTARDSGSGFIKFYEWDFDGDGSVDTSGTTNAFNHVYPDTSSSARYVAKFCATDDDDNRACDTTTVTVTNRAPTLSGWITMEAVGLNIVFRATQLSISDPENNHRDSLWWDFDNDGTFETATRRTDVVTRAVAATSRTVKVRTRDKWGVVSNVVAGDVYAAIMAFDYSCGNVGSGFMTAFGSTAWAEGTSKVEAYSQTYGDWYLMDHPLGKAKCPANIADPTLEESACYLGWNNDDGITDTGFAVRVSLPEFVNPTGWGWNDGGLIYIFDGTQIESAKYVNIGGSVTVKFWAEAGKPVAIFLYDKNYLEPADPYAAGVMKASLIGTGAWQEVTKLTSDFAPAYAGATNTLDPTHVKAITLEYELSASSMGQPIANATGYPIVNSKLVWQKLSFQ